MLTPHAALQCKPPHRHSSTHSMSPTLWHQEAPVRTPQHDHDGVVDSRSDIGRRSGLPSAYPSHRGMREPSQ